MWVYWMKSFRKLNYNFAGDILIEPSRTCHQINPHIRFYVRLSGENLYHKLFSDLNSTIQSDDFAIGTAFASNIEYPS